MDDHADDLGGIRLAVLWLAVVHARHHDLSLPIHVDLRRSVGIGVEQQTPVTTITAKAPLVQGSIRLVNSETGSLLKVTPKRRRSIITAVPTNSPVVRTCVDSSSGYTQNDSRMSTLQGVVPNPSKSLCTKPQSPSVRVPGRSVSTAYVAWQPVQTA